MSSVSPADAPLKAVVLCRLRPGVVDRFRLHAAETLVGRERGLGISIPLLSVSRRHARITHDGKSWWLHGLSPAGTFLNGQLIVRERLHHLDVITLGRGVDLIFLVRQAGVASAAGLGIVRAALQLEGSEEVREIALGEITLGRSGAANVVAENAAVSKIHARITRTPTQLVLEDLSSSNGTFVDGRRVSTAHLRDADRVSLAGVVNYFIVVELGEMELTATVPGAQDVAPRVTDAVAPFSIEWKTRYDWDSAEMEGLQALQREMADKQAARSPDVRPARTPGAAPVPAPPVAIRPAPAAPAIEGSILELRLEGPGAMFTVSKPGRYELGRAPDARLHMADPSISRRQAVVTLTEDRNAALLEDLGGLNPTRLNDSAVQATTALAEGDVIGVGGVQLKVKLVRR